MSTELAMNDALRAQYIRARESGLLFRKVYGARSDLIESLEAGKYKPGLARKYMHFRQKWRATLFKAKR